MSRTGRVVAFIVFAVVLTLVLYWGVTSITSSKQLTTAREALANAPVPLREIYERSEASPPPSSDREVLAEDEESPWELIDSASQQWTELFTDKDGWDWQKYGPFMQSQQDLITRIRAAAARGAFAHKEPLTLENIAGLNDKLGKIRQAARILQADALYQAAQGDYDAYALDLAAILQISGHLTDPVIISQLVRIAVTGVAFYTAAEGPHGGALGGDARQAILDAAANAAQAQRDAIAEAYAYECQWLADRFDAIRAGEAGEGFGAWLISSPLARPWVNLDEAAWSQMAIETTEALTLPYSEGQARLESIETEGENLPFTRIMSRTMGTMVPAMSRAQESAARQEAMLDLMQLGMQIEAYEAENGAYPGSLELLGAEMTDPFTGGPYVYRPGGSDFLLYSPGANGDDDGKVPLPGKPSSGDIVWRGDL